MLVVSFSFAATSEVCNVMGVCDCPCSQWEGVHIKGLTNNTLVNAWTRTGLIAQPNAASGARSHLGTALAHISAWKSIETQRPEGATLILPEDEAVRPERTSDVARLMESASRPTFDIFFLSSLPQPLELEAGPGLPPHVLRLAQNASDLVPAKSTRLHAYAMSYSGALTWLQLLRAAPPDLSVLPLDQWMLRHIRANVSLRALTWDNDTELIEGLGGSLKGSAGGLL